MNVKAFLGFLFVVFITITLFIIAISLARGNSEEEVTKTNLTEHINIESKSVYTVRGSIVANEEHEGYRITISQNQRSLELLKGYDNRVVKRSVYPNSFDAYEEFVFALNIAGLNNVNDEDTRGFCASGNLYDFEFFEGQDQLAREWYTSCGSFSKKRFSPDNLFRSQIPDFSEATSEVRL